MLTRAQLEAIPGRFFYDPKTTELREYLEARGLTMSLAELDAERRRRRQP